MSKKLIVMVDDEPEKFEGKYIKKREGEIEYSLDPLKERFLKVCGNSRCNYRFKFFQFWWDAYKTLKDCLNDYADILFILDVHGDNELSTKETEERDGWIKEQFKTTELSVRKINDLPAELKHYEEGITFLKWIHNIGKIENVMLMSSITSHRQLAYIWRVKQHWTESEDLSKAQDLNDKSNSFTKPMNVSDNTITEHIKKFQRRFCSDCWNRQTIADLDFIQWEELKSISTPGKNWEKGRHPHHAKKESPDQIYIRERIEKNEKVKKIYEEIGYDLAKNIGGEINDIEKTPVWILLDDSNPNKFDDYFESLFDLRCLSFAKDSQVVKDNYFWEKKFANLHKNLSQRYLWFNYIGLIKSMFKLEASNAAHHTNYRFADAEFVEIYSEDPDDIYGLCVKIFEKDYKQTDGIKFNPDFPINAAKVARGDVTPYRNYINLRINEGKYCVAQFVEEIFRLGAAWFCYFALNGKNHYNYKLFRSNYKESIEGVEDPFEDITKEFLVENAISYENYNLPIFSFFIPARKFKTNYYGDERDFFTLLVGESDTIINGTSGVKQRVKKYIMRTDLAGMFFSRWKD